MSKLAHGVVWQAWLPGRRTSTPAYRPSNASKVAVVRALVIRLLSELGSNHAGSKCIRQLAYSPSEHGSDGSWGFVETPSLCCTRPLH